MSFSNHRRRVVVTGLGLVSPVGNTVEAAWSSLLAGKSGISAIRKFDHSLLSVHIAAEVKDFRIEDYLSAKDARHLDSFIQYGIAAGTQAMRDCAIEVNEANAERIGVMVGSGIGGLPSIEETGAELIKRGPRRISPFFVPGSIINMISGQLSIIFGLKGPNIATVTACTTGLHSIGLAARLIQYGDADVMISGSSESTISALGIGGLESVLTVLALHHQKSPPTTNIFRQDPQCDLDHCANTARDLKINFAVKNNFGFGGTNGSLVFGKI
jgi:3-oxoacyl-[acyl-carrier-protein] synthase II